MEPASISSGKPPMGAVRAVPVLAGFSAVAGQAVLLREMIVLFSGNEISLGIGLAAWMLWTAAGSGVSSWISRDRLLPRTGVAVLECCAGVSLAPTIGLLRAGRVAFQIAPGELLGPMPMLVTALAALSLYCSFSGALFVAAARLVREECGVSPGVAASRVYLLEAAGAGLGGILTSLLFLRSVGSLQIAMAVAVLNFVLAAIVFFGLTARKMAAVALLGIAAFIPLAVFVAPRVDHASLATLWSGFEVLDSRNTIYGNLTVVRAGNLRTVYDNGVKLATVPDEASAEEAVHYALLEHPAPATVLLIGGAISGGIPQALEHPSVRRLDVVELDPALLTIARQISPGSTAPPLSDTRVRVHIADARLWLKTTRDRFDVILIDLPDPETEQLNRFYTEEFFRSVRARLAPAGIFAFQVRSSEESISPALAAFLRCIAGTVRAVFPQVAIIPGETTHFFAAEQANLLTEDPQVLITRLEERRLPTQYVREYFIPYRMTPDRMEQAHALLQPSPGTPVNRDFRPIACYFDILLWSTQFRSPFARMFGAAAHIPFPLLLGGTLLVLALFLLPVGLLRRENAARPAALICAGVSGYTLMALEILLLFTFQSVYGFVYQELAILIGMFLAGLGLGSWLGMRRISAADPGSLMAPIARTQILLSCSAPVLLLVAALLARGSDSRSGLAVAQGIFPLLALLCGVPGGYLFPLANEVWLRGHGTASGAGTIYALDLLGGALGAILLSGYCIPVFGFWNAAWFTAALSAAPAFLAARAAAREPKVALPPAGSRQTPQQ